MTTISFREDDQSLKYAKDAGIFISGVEAELSASRLLFTRKEIFRNAPAVFLCFGQSNAANHGQGQYSPQHRVFCFNPMDSQFYVAEDPIPGATGSGGSAWPRLGDALIAANYSEAVLFLSIAFGGSYLAEWAPGGPLSRRLAFAIERMKRNAIHINGLLWWQGEAEANRTSMKRDDYKAQFLAMLLQIREHGIDAPVFVARSTLCANSDHPFDNRDEIRAAQFELASAEAGIVAGPDTDRIGLDGRMDRCHLNEDGLRRAAEAWFQAITSSGRSWKAR